MGRLAAAGLIAVALMAPVACAEAARAESARDARCAAARDGRLAALDEEAQAVAVAFDTDASVAGSPEYQLLKDKEALLREIAAERNAAWEDYRRCAGGGDAR